MDLLSDVLRSIRLSGAVLFRGEFSAPWAVAAPPARTVAALLHPDAAHLVLFHVVAEGSAWAKTAQGDHTDIAAGDIVVLCGGDAHVLGSGAPERTAQIGEILPPRPWPEPPRLHYGGGGERTAIVCGFLHCDEIVFHPLLRTLPRLLRVRMGTSAEWVEANLRYPLEEAGAGRPGSSSLLARAAELLFVDVLRRHLADGPAEERGWLAALRDPAVATALELLHGDPAAAWSVGLLARRVGTSRTVLSERFRLHLGQPPMQYLTRWRIQLAARMLSDQEESIAAVAERVGYESERAFHRAFKRHAGVTPAAWRKGRRCGTGATGVPASGRSPLRA